MWSSHVRFLFDMFCPPPKIYFDKWLLIVHYISDKKVSVFFFFIKKTVAFDEDTQFQTVRYGILKSKQKDTTAVPLTIIGALRLFLSEESVAPPPPLAAPIYIKSSSSSGPHEYQNLTPVTRKI